MRGLFLILVSVVVLGLAQETPRDCILVRCAIPVPSGCERKQGTCCDYVCSTRTPVKCTTNSQCEQGSFCKKTSCRRDASGICEVKNSTCPRTFSPVCGCDGKTYVNTCRADSSGTSVRHVGRCSDPIPPPQPPPSNIQPPPPPPPPTTTKECTKDSQCGQGSFCKKTSCRRDETGTCEVKSSICPLNFAPVCGCDGQTYGNECHADASGMPIQYRGECNIEYCNSDSQCGQNSYCKKTSCSQTETGTCQVKSTICPLSYTPVCGCDGQTYGNACEAGASGTSVHHVGECRSVQPSVVRSCTTESQCGQNFFCKKSSCSGLFGVCAQTPFCGQDWAPVCGCNGQTYQNLCRAGGNIRHLGECETTEPTFERSLAVSDQVSQSTSEDTAFPPYAIGLVVIGSLLLIAVVTLVVLVFAVKAKMSNVAERY